MGNINGLLYLEDSSSNRDAEQDEAVQGKILLFIIHFIMLMLLLVFIGLQIVSSKFESKNRKSLHSISQFAVRVHSIQSGYKGNLVNDIQTTAHFMFGDGGYD